MPFNRPLSGGCEMTGTIKGGVFYVDDKRTLALQIAKLPEGPAILRLEPVSGARSLADNRRYFGILENVVKASGQDQKTLHKHYREKFNNDRSTTVLDEQRFRLYVDQVMGDAAAEWGVEFPVPEALCR